MENLACDLGCLAQAFPRLRGQLQPASDLLANMEVDPRSAGLAALMAMGSRDDVGLAAPEDVVAVLRAFAGLSSEAARQRAALAVGAQRRWAGALPQVIDLLEAVQAAPAAAWAGIQRAAAQEDVPPSAADMRACLAIVAASPEADLDSWPPGWRMDELARPQTAQLLQDAEPEARLELLQGLPAFWAAWPQSERAALFAQALPALEAMGQAAPSARLAMQRAAATAASGAHPAAADRLRMPLWMARPGQEVRHSLSRDVAAWVGQNVGAALQTRALRAVRQLPPALQARLAASSRVFPPRKLASEDLYHT
jgi:hypothetical protein